MLVKTTKRTISGKSKTPITTKYRSQTNPAWTPLLDTKIEYDQT